MNTTTNPPESTSSKEQILNRFRSRVHGAVSLQSAAAWPMLPELPENLPVIERNDGFEVQGPVLGAHEPAPQGDMTQAAHIVRYWDGYSHESWGRMPETIPGYGASQCALAHALLSELEHPHPWVEFSKGIQALHLRKGNRFGAAFNEVGELLQRQGVRTHRLGLACVAGAGAQKERFFAGGARLSVVPWVEASWKKQTFLGRTLYQYHLPRTPDAKPVALPFQFRFHFRLGALTSSLSDPGYFSRRGLRSSPLDPQKNLDLPFLDLWTQNELTPRSVEWEEAVALAAQWGLDAAAFQRLCFTSIWIAGFWRQKLQTHQMELDSGILRWARAADGTLVLIAQPTLTELQVRDAEGPLSLAFLLRDHEGTPWLNALRQAQSWEVQPQQDLPEFSTVHAAREAVRAQWKKRVPLNPKTLAAERVQLAALLGPSICRSLGIPGFEDSIGVAEWRKKEKAFAAETRKN